MDLQTIQNKIYEIRGKKVMLDFDLADLYELKTKNLNLAVKRNIKRFPEDFMFKLSQVEWDSLRLQNETSKGRGGTRYLPNAFSEQDLAMLSGVLKSDKAINVNISIMRAFVQLRHIVLTHSELAKQLKQMETKYDKHFVDVNEALKYFFKKDKQEKQFKNRTRIGFDIRKHPKG